MSLPSELSLSNRMHKAALEVLGQHKKYIGCNEPMHEIVVQCGTYDAHELKLAIAALVPSAGNCTIYVLNNLPSADNISDTPEDIEDSKRDLQLRWRIPDKSIFFDLTEFLINNNILPPERFIGR